MDISSAILTVVIPLFAYLLYYTHRLQLQLSESCSDTSHGGQSKESGRPLPTAARKQSLVDHGGSVESSREFVLQDAREHIFKYGSSVLCQGSTNVDRRCLFHNLCYHPRHKDFVFLHAPRSVSEGVPEERQQPSLIDLSSMPNHNTQYFDYVDAPSSLLESVVNLTYLEGQYLLFNRFNPGNLMHVFHDDLLPVFYTLLQLGYIWAGSDVSSATLLVNDRHGKGEYFHLYKHFSHGEPILMNNLSPDVSDLLCFKEVHIGLSKLTTWYQYGFQVPQGPLDNVIVSSREILLFSSFLKSKLNISGECANRGGKDTIVLLSRRSNRLILNELEVSLALAQKFDAYVVVASLETHSLAEIAHTISCSKVMVGVHGSLLLLSLFLPPDSVLVEIFPYAINPDNYTPYKTLASLKGTRIVYRSWRNDDMENTISHPDAVPELGGITHLDPEVQQEILAGVEVPPHLCCSDPHWLFRIYQDTLVNVQSLVEVVESGLSESRSQVTEAAEAGPGAEIFQPGPIRDAACFTAPAREGDGVSLALSWQPPWNLDFFPPESATVDYEVSIQEQGEGDLYAGAFILPWTSHVFAEDFKKGRTYYVWIRCRRGTKTGPYVAITSCPYKMA